MTGRSISNLRRVLVKCVNWNLLGANIDACLKAYCVAISIVLLSLAHVSSVDLPQHRMPMSSIYPVAIVFYCWLLVSMRSAL